MFAPKETSISSRCTSLRSASCYATVWAIAAQALVLACAAPEGGRQSRGPGDPLDTISEARGERLFLGSCAGYCHSPAHGGRGGAPDLFDCQWLYGATDEAVYRSISAGVPESDMPAFADLLSESDRWLLVAWLRAQSRCAETARELSREACTR